MEEIDILKSKLQENDNELDQMNQKLKKLQISNPTTLMTEMVALESARNTSVIIQEFECNFTEDEINYLIDLAKEALIKENSFFDVAKYIHGNINSFEKLKNYLWVIVVDIKGRVRNIHYSAHKDLRIILNDVLIGFTACKIDLPEEEEIESSRQLFDQYQLKGRKNVDDHLVDFFVNECKSALKDHDTFDGMANQLRKKLEETTNTVWAVIVYTSDSVSYSLRTFKNMLVTINRLKINAYEIRH